MKPEEMTLDEIREQLALYNRLYYQKKKTGNRLYGHQKSQCTKTPRKKQNR